MAGGMHGWGGGHAWQGACMAGSVHGRGEHAWQGACMAWGCVAGSTHGRGACVAGGMAGGMCGGGHAWQGGLCGRSDLFALKHSGVGPPHHPY